MAERREVQNDLRDRKRSIHWLPDRFDVVRHCRVPYAPGDFSTRTSPGRKTLSAHERNPPSLVTSREAAAAHHENPKKSCWKDVISHVVTTYGGERLSKNDDRMRLIHPDFAAFIATRHIICVVN